MGSILFKISFFAYALATLCYLFQWIFQKKIMPLLGQRFALLGFVIQTLGGVIYVMHTGYPFLIKSADSYLFSAWILSGIFLVMRLRYLLEAVGSIFLAAILILFVLAHFSTEIYVGEARDLEIMLSPWASIHIVFGFLSFSVFCLSFIMGLLFLFQEFQLKSKRIGSFFNRLPALELLDQLHYKALSVGLGLLTLVIITGSAWAKSVRGVYFFSDPRQLWSIIAWLVYACFFQVRFSSGWRGRRAILLSLTGFLVILFTFLEVRHV